VTQKNPTFGTYLNSYRFGALLHSQTLPTDCSAGFESTPCAQYNYSN